MNLKVWKDEQGRRTAGFSFVAVVLTLLSTVPAHADVVGRLRIVVKNIDSEKPVAGATVVLHDSAGVRPDTTLTTGDDGSVTTDSIENRPFTVTVSGSNFETGTQSATVVADTTTDVAVELEPVEKTIKVSGARTALRRRNTGTVATRSRNFIANTPASNNNPQQLTGLVSTVPGFVLDSNNQAHPRGEHTATTLYLGGFQLGSTLQGRFGPIIAPDALENLDVQTGSYAPEYGSETAAMLNATVRSGTIKPTYGFDLGGGSFSDRQAIFSLGGQAGAPLGAPDAQGRQAKRFGYFISGTARSTDNALEPPQPDNQTAHNHASAESLLGRFDYTSSTRDKFTLTMSTAPANTQVANRTGLPDQYAPYGQGFGYGGALSRSQAALQGITSQEADGQDINQRDSNNFGILQWRHTFNPTTTGLLSFGLQNGKLDVTNNNPGVNLSALPNDNSIEFNPTVRRDAKHTQGEGSLTKLSGDHTLKAGFVLDEQRGNESYQLTPASQLATDALFANAPTLLPAGAPVLDGGGNPVLDANGNPVYAITPGATSPVVNINRNGYYRAAYVQDTWKVTPKFTANYGLRFDAFKQTPNIGTSVRATQLSPRLNLSYALQPTLLARLSYNRLFTQPPLAEGATPGDSILPARTNLYEGSLEKEIRAGQTIKVGYYYKQITNAIDVALLIPGSQIGIYRAVNLQDDQIHGFELSYDFTPRNNIGPNAFLSYAYSIAKFRDGADSGYNDHDQRNTLSAGTGYNFKNGASTAISVYYGSGLASSVLYDGGPRHSRTRVDLNLSSGPKLFKGYGGLRLAVDNLFDDRSLVNFNSDFSGTRFQQGRRIVLSAFTNF